MYYCIGALLLAFPKNTGDSNDVNQTSDSYLTDDEIESLLESDNQFLGRKIILEGQVSLLEETSDGYILDMACESKTSTFYTTVKVITDKKIIAGDCFSIDGTIVRSLTKENEYDCCGIDRTEWSWEPEIIATSFKKQSYAETFHKTLKKVIPEDASITQHECNITISKIEFAEDQTRIYVKATNNSNEKFNIYSSNYDSEDLVYKSSNCKIVQAKKQYDELIYYDEYCAYDGNLPTLQSKIFPGVISEGILVFPPIDQSDFSIFIEGRLSDDTLNFDIYKFDIEVN